MMRLALTAIATLTAADPVMADLAVAERVFSWRSSSWSVFGTPGECLAGPLESTALELSWSSDRDGGIAVSANHPIGDMDPRAVWRLLASSELQMVPISRGRAIQDMSFSFAPIAEVPAGKNQAHIRTPEPLPLNLIEKWIDRDVDEIHMKLPGRLGDITVSLGEQTILQLTLCREMMRDS